MIQSPTQVVELQTNLDDVTGEIIGHALETLMAHGALDAWVVPAMMKKNRPGSILCVLVAQEVADQMARRVLELTGSFGVRFRAWDRLILDRELQTVESSLGPVCLKVGRLDGRVIVAKPEFEDVRQMAQKLNRPVAEVMAAARAAASILMQQTDGESP
jgi:uncharacterized protein (DUF111 family)